MLSRLTPDNGDVRIIGMVDESGRVSPSRIRNSCVRSAITTHQKLSSTIPSFLVRGALCDGLAAPDIAHRHVIGRASGVGMHPRVRWTLGQPQSLQVVGGRSTTSRADDLTSAGTAVCGDTWKQTFTSWTRMTGTGRPWAFHGQRAL